MEDLQPGEQRLDAVGGLDDVRAGLALDVHNHGGVIVDPSGQMDVFHVVHHLADVLEADGRAFDHFDDDVAIFGGGEDLVVGADGIGLLAAVETAFGQIDIVEHEGAADVFHAQAQTGQGGGIDAHADGRLLVAFDGDQPDAGDLAQFLGQDGVGQVVDFGQGQFLGGELEGEDGGVGRVDFVKDGRVGHAVGEHSAGGVDGGLHVLGGGIYVPIQVELEGDGGGAKGADGGHLGKAADLAELPLQGSVTEEAMTSGLAPGYWPTTWMVGKSTGGRAEIGNSS